MIYIVMSYAFCFYSLSRNNIILSKGFSLIFLHNSYGTPKICLSLVGANLVGNMRWHHTKTYVTFRWVHTELSRHFRKDHTERPCNLGGTVQSSSLAKCWAIISTNLSAHWAICWQELPSWCICLRHMWCFTILSPFGTKTRPGILAMPDPTIYI